MGKTKQKPALTSEALRPYVQRAITDPDLRDDLLAAFVAARGLYGQMAKGRGVKGKAEKVSEKDFQKQLQGLVDELTTASGRLQGKAKRKSHKARNRVILLTGVTLGVLYNPWTGESTREWIMNQIAGDDEEFDEAEAEHDAAAEAASGGNGSEPARHDSGASAVERAERQALAERRRCLVRWRQALQAAVEAGLGGERPSDDHTFVVLRREPASS